MRPCNGIEKNHRFFQATIKVRDNYVEDVDDNLAWLHHNAQIRDGLRDAPQSSSHHTTSQNVQPFMIVQRVTTSVTVVALIQAVWDNSLI